ncbi:hypothetical protein [Streptomyces sp. GQFP]|uniref:hypothetical protein n=1 Tax=Streptomyces sp. GQFP TaxID=2907545 RepID=UPI001F22E06A|nr:hypothetical protein [Streptomyces sp. GQFP]UIX30223.1 hypothetical protein LUX31_09340 [Streptomyces sp. GQFP]
MSEQRWEEESGGAGDIQAVAGDAEFIRIHEESYDVATYRRMLDHGQSCPECREGVCPEARALWRAVKRREP